MKKSTFIFLSNVFVCFFLFVSFVANSQNTATLTVKDGKPAIVCNGVGVSIYANSNFEKPSSYEWIKDGVRLIENDQPEFVASQPGTYKVVVHQQDKSTESNPVLIGQCPTEEKKTGSATISVNTPVITSTNGVICGSSTSAPLVCSIQDPNYIYKWYYSSTYSGTYNLISGANTYTYTAANVGFYKVFVDDNATSPAISYPYEVLNHSRIIISDLSDNLFATINTTSGATINLKLRLEGFTLPASVTIRNGGDFKTYTVTTNPFTFSAIAYSENARISIYSTTNACNGNSTIYGDVTTIVDNATNFTLGVQNNENVCAGGTFNVPYTTTGTWNGGRLLYTYITDPVNNNIVGNSSRMGLNPYKLDIPSTLTLNKQYKITVVSELPYVSSGGKTFFITPTSSGCTPEPTISVNYTNQSCNTIELFANPYSSSNTYKWYKDNVLIAGATSSAYTATVTGDYKVEINNSSIGYSATSSPYTITITGQTPIISGTSNSVCENIAVTLSSSLNNNTYSYQWFFGSSQYGIYNTISGATSSTYNTIQGGYYKVEVTSGACQTTSNSFYLSPTPILSVSSVNGVNGAVTINPGETVALQVNMSGSGPYTFTYRDGQNYHYVQTSSNPYTLNVNPAYSTNYVFSGLTNACGISNRSVDYLVKVDSDTDFSLTTPPNTNTCLGGRIEIPYTTTGTWPNERYLILDLTTTTTGSSVPNSYQYRSVKNTDILYYDVPANLPTGTYYVNVRANIPNLSQRKVSTYTITINSTGCTTPSAKILLLTASYCNSDRYIEAYPRQSGTTNTYQWYKDGVLQTNYISDYFYARVAGNYTVQITNATTGYNSTSNTITLPNPTFPNFSSNFTGSTYCGSGAFTASASNVQAGNSYQWYYAPVGFGYQSIAGATGASYTNNQAGGSYYVITRNGACEIKDEFKCSVLLNFSSTAVCQQSSFNIPVISSTSSDIQFQLVDATTGAVVVQNLITTAVNGTSNVVANLPASVTAGNYKIKAIVLNQSIVITSVGVLTITSSVANAAPTITSSPSTITGATTVNTTVSGCTGTVVWSSYNNWSSGTGTSFSQTLYNGNVYTAYCQTADGCQSASSKSIVMFNCGDSYEPNDDNSTAKAASGVSFTSTPLCFGYYGDQDWFTFSINGKLYYVKIKHYSSSNTSTTQYLLKKDLVGNVLTLQTVTNPTGSYLDTQIYLYDANLTQIGYDDESNGNGLSKIVYNITNNCQSNVVLTSTLYDVQPTEISLVKSSNTIQATNQIFNTSFVGYEAQNAVLLLPGFETKLSTAGYFRAEAKTCN